MTTRKQFKRFCKRCRKWQLRLGLTDWELSCFHETIDQDGMAWCQADLDGRIAFLYLSADYIMSNAEVDACAKHEVLELLVAPLDMYARRRNVTDSEIDCARHAIIRRLEEVIK